MDFKDLALEFSKASRHMKGIMKKGVDTSTEDLLSQSKNLAPLDEGGLRENGSTTPAKVSRHDITGEVGYSKEYALRMHEDMYQPSTPGTGRKYLEKPTKENEEKYADYLGSLVGDAFDE
ncbi:MULTISPECIES: hypothetical protein [Virgibacillus]|uniref:HK97 gp10 family phage protein n=1 Tax=Virgibacillus halodenitrificans TaxID=1482 RepID=A0ABR7VLG3_VIRHA|nr:MULTISPECIES: hypothetical protein [Virgibacillus]AIF45430.1 hypothetical protein X953_10155 [Virgibacillus sp. SK37]MBD1222751.1 hypothetical protein [Virgibacillus halodenitrificans]